MTAETRPMSYPVAVVCMGTCYHYCLRGRRRRHCLLLATAYECRDTAQNRPADGEVEDSKGRCVIRLSLHGSGKVAKLPLLMEV